MNAMAPDNIVWQDVRRYVSPLVPDRFGYMTAEEGARVEAIRQRRMLFRGQHRDYFLAEGRTQFPVLSLRTAGGKVRPVYIPYNLLGLISRKGADLLFGEHPQIASKDPAVQAAIEAIDLRSNLRRVLFEAAVTCSWASEAFLEVSNDERGAYVTTPVVDEIFPVGPIGADGQYREYRRYATANVGTAQSPIELLLTTTYTAGVVRRELRQLDQAGRPTNPKLSLDQWPAFKESAPPEEQATGLDACSIVWVPNELVEGEAIGDYEVSLIFLQDLVNAKQSQLARAHAIHANPKMYFATGSADNDGNIRSDQEAFFGDTPEGKPSYIETTGSPDAAMRDRDFAVAALCAMAEMTPELLGIKNDAAADSARKMRLAASSPLAKTERRTAYWQPALQRVMTLAARVELGRPIPDGAVGVEIRDGLPEDELDTANIIATLRAADALSLQRALRMLGLDAGAADEEAKQIETERAARMPTTLLGEPPLSGSPTDDDQPQPGVA